MKIIDLRSDTVSHPTPEMREAMAIAEVGDDVFGDDPTVNRLQELAAERMGKEAGLFVASGTMGNLIAVLAHCQRGDEAIMGTQAHTVNYEQGGISALGGVFPHTIPNLSDGTLRLEDIEAAIRGEDVHFSVSRMIILENTQNRCGGVVLTVEYTRQVAELAKRHSLQLHIDGARIFNAAAALKADVLELCRPADSITFCLSKGLCAPVGSVLCGTKDFIYRARRLRKQLGGGMRQVGVLAAAGIIALEKMSLRLSEDHTHARQLAEGLANIPGLELDFGLPASNMVFASLKSSVHQNAKDITDLLANDGIRVGVVAERRIRLVTHFWITDEAVNRTLSAFSRVLKTV
ncbi:MAG: low-specificity L-threonine aldolase [Leptolinea sp.]